MSPGGNDHGHHHVEATIRLLRLRIKLSSAMWLPVLAANVFAVGLAIGLPVLDRHLGDERSLTSRRPPLRRSSGRSPAA